MGMTTRKYSDVKIYRRLIIFLMLLAVIIMGCSESPFDPEDPVPTLKIAWTKIRISDEIPGVLTALDFPAADGSLWEYVSLDGEHTYTAQINGTKNVGGVTVRIQESDSEIPVTQQGLLFGVPVRNSLFTKDIDSYTEHGFDLWLASVEDTFFQRNLPKRVLWSFPLYVGKEWTVSKSISAPEVTYTREVVSDSNVITVPAGTFQNVYYVEENSVFAGLLDEEQLPPSKYWIAPDVGVIKYEFWDPFFSVTTSYELSKFEQ